MKRKKGFYSISVVAKMFSVHQQTVRMYEKEGLISPKRSEGNTRLFSEEDVDRLEEIINLTHKMGVNLAGVEIILKLQKKIKRMQDEMNALFSKFQDQLDEESNSYKDDLKLRVGRLAQMKKESPLLEEKKTFDNREEEVLCNDIDNESTDELSDWEIEYDRDDK